MKSRSGPAFRIEIRGLDRFTRDALIGLSRIAARQHGANGGAHFRLRRAPLGDRLMVEGPNGGRALATAGAAGTLAAFRFRFCGRVGGGARTALAGILRRHVLFVDHCGVTLPAGAIRPAAWEDMCQSLFARAPAIRCPGEAESYFLLPRKRRGAKLELARTRERFGAPTFQIDCQTNLSLPALRRRLRHVRLLSVPDLEDVACSILLLRTPGGNIRLDLRSLAANGPASFDNWLRSEGWWMVARG